MEKFAPYIDWQEDCAQLPRSPDATVVIVAYNTNLGLVRCLDSLQEQSIKNFETIVVDNGKNESVLETIRKYPIRYIRLKKNYRPSIARNIGIAQVQGNTICFLDDDAIADPYFVKQHLLANQQPGVLGVRGKILPKTKNSYNQLAWHYDLGSEVKPAYIDLEGNASFPKKVLMEVGGFNQDVFGGEGAELSYRIVDKYGDRDCLIYWPEAVIYHDYASNYIKYMRKSLRGARMGVILERQIPGLNAFIQSYDLFQPTKFVRSQNLAERIKMVIIWRTQSLLYRYAPRWYRWSLKTG